jgi:hypothetical protein
LSQVCAVLGTQWGDEGKGKLVDILARQYDVVARCQVLTPFCSVFDLCYLLTQLLYNCGSGLFQQSYEFFGKFKFRKAGLYHLS